MPLTLEQRLELAETLAKRKVEVFNEKFPSGTPVLYIPTPDAEAEWDRVYGSAHVIDGHSIVYLAARELPVLTDQCFAPPAEMKPHRGPELSMPFWKLAAAAALGAGLVVLAALATPAAKAVPPEMIVIDCDAVPPDNAPAPADADEGSTQA